MENTASTKRDPAAPLASTRDLLYGMMKTKTIKILNTETYPKVFSTKTPRFSFAAAQLVVPARRSLCPTKLHSYYLLTSLIFARRWVVMTKTIILSTFAQTFKTTNLRKKINFQVVCVFIIIFRLKVWEWRQSSSNSMTKTEAISITKVANFHSEYTEQIKTTCFFYVTTHRRDKTALWCQVKKPCLSLPSHRNIDAGKI